MYKLDLHEDNKNGIILQMSKELRAVPLPEVAEYTDAIQIGSLGLPQGFDDERVLVNVGAIERFRKAEGLGELTIQATYLESSHPAVAGMDRQGTAVLENLRSASSRKLTRISYMDDGPELDDAMENLSRKFPGIGFAFNMILSNMRTLRLNNMALTLDLRERDMHARAHKTPRSVLDPKFQGNYLNTAVREGLWSINQKINADRYLMTTSGLIAGFVLGMHEMGLDNPNPTLGLNVAEQLAVVAAERPVVTTLVALTSAVLKKKRGLDDSVKDAFVDIMRNTRQSVLFGATLDRYALSAGVLTTSGKLIKVQK